MKNNLTFTVIANITSNYGESLGNVSSIQKQNRNQKLYASRSSESMKYAIMKQAGFYDNLETEAPNKVAIKTVSDTIKLDKYKGLEGGYLSTKKSEKTKTKNKNKKVEDTLEEEISTNNSNKNNTYKRNSSFYLTPAISVNPFMGDTQFRNNLNLAQKVAELTGKNVQNNASDCGLMPFNYEFEKDLKVYSITIFLDEIGVDTNFNVNIPNNEKEERVFELINAIQNLYLQVKGSIDNAEPLFIVGGLSNRKSHEFENILIIKNNEVVITNDLKDRVKNFHCGIVSGIFENESSLNKELNATSVDSFFSKIKDDVSDYYKNI